MMKASNISNPPSFIEILIYKAISTRGAFPSAGNTKFCRQGRGPCVVERMKQGRRIAVLEFKREVLQMNPKRHLQPCILLLAFFICFQTLAWEPAARPRARDI